MRYRRGRHTLRLDETNDETRAGFITAHAVRIRRGNAADVWQITVETRDAAQTAVTLFTLPLGVSRWEEVVDRITSILGAVDLTVEPGWRQIRPGHLAGPIRYQT